MCEDKKCNSSSAPSELETLHSSNVKPGEVFAQTCKQCLTMIRDREYNKYLKKALTNSAIELGRCFSDNLHGQLALKIFTKVCFAARE